MNERKDAAFTSAVANFYESRAFQRNLRVFVCVNSHISQITLGDTHNMSGIKLMPKLMPLFSCSVQLLQIIIPRKSSCSAKFVFMNLLFGQKLH